MKRRGFLQALGAIGIAAPFIKPVIAEAETIAPRFARGEAYKVSEIRGSHPDMIITDDYSDFAKGKFILKIGRDRIAARGELFKVEESKSEMIDVTSLEHTGGYREYVSGRKDTMMRLVSNKLYALGEALEVDRIEITVGNVNIKATCDVAEVHHHCQHKAIFVIRINEIEAS